MENEGKKTSRRDVLKLGACGLGAIGAMSLASSANAQVAKKAAQKAVMYQQTPKDGKQCSGCQHFEAPSACRIVDGEINANGYCILFAKKPA
jgi:anaerobic selenocysteine-containing dehydrogenase